MSSAVKPDNKGGQTANAMSSKFMDVNHRLGMSPRQQTLNRYWSYYKCCQYDARRVDWDGRERADPIEHEAIATAGFIPPGFYDAGQSFPLKFRKPTAPYHLVKVIVDRFTGLLFSERRHPQLRVPGDPDTEDYVQALAEVSRLWASMIQVRTYGGAQGTVCVGFQFLDGRPVVEVHDARWTRPTFADRATLRLSAIEKRYIYPVEEKDPETGAYVEIPYWYRRVIDGQADTLWKPQPVGDGEEPDWEDERTVEQQVAHGLGFCPVLWVQNMPVVDDIDGDPDCHGIYDLSESIDALNAQANRGTLANGDPTVHVATDKPLGEISKGSDNCIKTEKGGSVAYVELNGSGAKASTDLSDRFRSLALEVAQCVLEHPGEAGAKTATEIERVFSSMLSKADVLREQYGERCCKPLVEMMVKAAKHKTQAMRHDDGYIERGTIALPDRVVKHDDGSVERIARRLGPGGMPVQLQWPGYFEPVLTDIQSAVTSAAGAIAAGIIDLEHAAKFIAEYFRVEDVPAMLAKLKEETERKQQEQMQMAMAQMQAPPSGYENGNGAGQQDDQPQ